MKVNITEYKHSTIQLTDHTVNVILDYVLANHTSIGGSIAWLNKKGQITLLPKNLDWDIDSVELDEQVIARYCQKHNLDLETVMRKLR